MCVIYPHFSFQLLKVQTVFHSLVISYCEEKGEGADGAPANRDETEQNQGDEQTMQI